jgi:hypothetical protein
MPPQNATVPAPATPNFDAIPGHVALDEGNTLQQAKTELPQPELAKPWEQEPRLDVPPTTRLGKAYNSAKAWLGEHEQHLSDRVLKPFREGLDRMGEDLQQAAGTGHTKTGGQLTTPTRLLLGGVGTLLKQVPVGRNVSETVQAMATPPELGPEGKALSRELKATEKVGETTEKLNFSKIPGHVELSAPQAATPNATAKELPPQPRLPDTGTHAAIKTDDGSIYFDDAPEKQRTHIMLAKDLGIPAERVVSGGWLKDGEYEGSERSDAGRWGEQARAQAAVAEKRTGANPPSQQPLAEPSIPWDGEGKIGDVYLLNSTQFPTRLPSEEKLEPKKVASLKDQFLTDKDQRPIPAVVAEDNGDGTYTVIDGHHRLEAAKASRLQASARSPVYTSPDDLATPAPIKQPEPEAWKKYPAAENIAKEAEQRGNELVFRRVRSPEEAQAILDSLAKNKPSDGFRTASVIDGHALSTKSPKIQAAIKKGAVPIFTSPYPTAANWYKGGADMFLAIEHAPEGRIYTSSRAGQTQGAAYSATFPDAEHVIDARSIKNVSVLSPEQVGRIAEHENNFEQGIRRGAFRGAYKDVDPELARANLQAARNLSPVVKSLNRPFVEAPVKTSSGLPVKKGDRVRLASGATGVLSGYREFTPEQSAGFWKGEKHGFSLTGVKGELPTHYAGETQDSARLNQMGRDIAAVWDKANKKWIEADPQRQVNNEAGKALGSKETE